MIDRRKFANYPGWKRILQHRFYHSSMDTPAFKGHITLYCMDAVAAPLVVNYFQRETCIIDAGYAWLKQFPDGGHHFTVTTHFDASGRIMRGISTFVCVQVSVKTNSLAG